MKYLNIICFSLILAGCCLENTNSENATVPTYISNNGTTYYFSNSGSDSSLGNSQNSPLKTISHLNNIELKPGDTVLFERGSIFRGPLYSKSGNSASWVKYGAYGSGENPIILGSISEMSISSYWSNYSGNIWNSNLTSEYYDIGALYMNNQSILGSKKWNISDLGSPGDFYFNTDDRKLYLYTTSSNPANYYTDIEVSITTNIIDYSNTKYVLFENLHLSLGAAHGFGGSNTESIIIKACEINFIGGGFLYTNNNGENIRYGNAIEFWQNSKNILVDGNYIYEIYDTAVTNQYSGPNLVVQENIRYINNIVYNCGLASFELWCRPFGSKMKDIYFVNNTSINPGHGWGSDRPDKNSFHIASFGSNASTENLVIKNNIFYTSEVPNNSDYHSFFYDEDIDGNNSTYIINNNLWNMPSPLWIVNNNLITSFEDWKNVNFQSSDGIYNNPDFLDLANKEFSLSFTSSGVNSGVETFRTWDFFSKNVVGKPDIGAIEL